MIWLLIGYMWMFIHRPFEIWPVLATLRVERVYMICTIVYWLASRPAFPSGNRLHRYFAAFVLVMLASWFLSPYQEAGNATVMNYLKYAVFYVLLVTSIRNEQDLCKIIAGFVAVMALLMAHSLREYFSGRTAFAQGVRRLLPVGASYDFNDFAGLIVCSLPFAWVLWRHFGGRGQRALVCGYFGLAGYCIVQTGSRMGFVGMVLASMFACLASPKRWQLLALYPVLLAAVWMILPQDRKDRYLTLYDTSPDPNGAVASAGRYRYGGLESALPLFEARPLLGFGPKGFGQARGDGMLPHNLYGQLLAELGIAGTVAFGSILLGISKNALEARRIVRDMGAVDNALPWHTVTGASAAILLLVIMSWGFNFLFWHVWLWFGGFQVVALQCLKRQAESVRGSEFILLEPQTGDHGT